MKARFFTLVTILILVVIGSLTYIKFNHDRKENEKQETTNEITEEPTSAPAATQVPVPTVISEDSTALFPAYQNVDDTVEYGYINTSGEFAITPSFDTAYDFHDGVAVVYMNNQYCAIDETGNIVYISNYTLNDFHNGAAVFSKYFNDKALYGYIDTTGKEIIAPTFKAASDFMEDGTAYVSTATGKYERIDKTGKVLESYELEPKYENPSSIQDGYIVYSEADNYKYGVVSVKGDVIFEPKYNNLRYLGNDLFAVAKSDIDSYGIIYPLPEALFNAKGEQLTDYTLYDISEFCDGYASASDDSHTFFIGLDGKEVSDLPKFEGAGKLKLFGDVIKAEIDMELSYSKKDGTVIWQNDNTQKLTANITAKSLKFKPNRFVVVYYPQIEGLTDQTVQKQINDKIKTLFVNNRAGLKIEDNLSVEDSFQAKLLDDLLIIERDGYDYPFGAAHGMPIMDFFYFDIKTGVSYTLKDLFKEGSDYTTKINELITADIKAQVETGDSMLFPESFTGIKEDHYFKLSENSLTIYFYPYDIAAYAAGFPEFEIPFKDISEYINMDGPFWLSFR